jgi:hypothetical protein
MLSDRRGSRRYTINRIAKYQADAYALPRDCMISDISDSGARLFAEGIDIPDQFNLLIDNDARGMRRQCEVVWRLGYELGVRFTDRVPAGWRI